MCTVAVSGGLLATETDFRSLHAGNDMFGPYEKTD